MFLLGCRSWLAARRNLATSIHQNTSIQINWPHCVAGTRKRLLLCSCWSCISINHSTVLVRLGGALTAGATHARTIGIKVEPARCWCCLARDHISISQTPRHGSSLLLSPDKTSNALPEASARAPTYRWRSKGVILTKMELANTLNTVRGLSPSVLLGKAKRKRKMRCLIEALPSCRDQRHETSEAEAA